MGRPRIQIDLAEVERLASEFCTQEEISVRLGISERTLRGRDDVRKAFERGKKGAFVSLRHAQFQLAQAGNASMLIWLGKVYLGQMEASEQERLTVERYKAGAADDELNELRAYRVQIREYP